MDSNTVQPDDVTVHWQDAAPAGAPPGGALGGLPFIMMMIAVFYFVLIRPQQKERKEQKKEGRNGKSLRIFEFSIFGLPPKFLPKYFLKISFDLSIKFLKKNQNFAKIQQKSLIPTRHKT